MKTLAIVCVDGMASIFRSLFFRNISPRLYMSDLINERLEKLVEDDSSWHRADIKGDEIILQSTTSLRRIVFLSLRGGMMRKRIRKVKAFMRLYNNPDTVLLACGKSYGGYNVVKSINSIDLWYKKSHLIVADALWFRKLFRPDLKLPFVQKGIYSTNFYQTNHKRLRGAEMVPGFPEEVNQVNLSQEVSHDPDVLNHFTIFDSSTMVQEQIDSSFNILLKLMNL